MQSNNKLCFRSRSFVYVWVGILVSTFNGTKYQMHSVKFVYCIIEKLERFEPA